MKQEAGVTLQGLGVKSDNIREQIAQVFWLNGLGYFQDRG